MLKAKYRKRRFLFRSELVKHGFLATNVKVKCHSDFLRAFLAWGRLVCAPVFM